MGYLDAMLAHRPYVVAFLFGFLAISLAERGWLGTLTWLAIGTFVGWLAEAVSIRTGFPFGLYSYHPERFPDELWIAGIPLFASISFAFLSYFAFSAARTLLGRIDGRGAAARRAGDPALDIAPRVAVLAGLITVWLDLVIDPVSLIGRYWFLGDLYHYAAQGFHFGVPLTNYAGWFLTCATVAFATQAVDRWLARRGRGPHPWFALPFQPYLGVVSCCGVLAFMLAIVLHTAAAGVLPPEVPIAAIGLNALVLSTLFVWLAVARLVRRTSLAPVEPASPLRTELHGA